MNTATTILLSISAFGFGFSARGIVDGHYVPPVPAVAPAPISLNGQAFKDVSGTEMIGMKKADFLTLLDGLKTAYQERNEALRALIICRGGKEL